MLEGFDYHSNSGLWLDFMLWHAMETLMFLKKIFLEEKQFSS